MMKHIRELRLDRLGIAGLALLLCAGVAHVLLVAPRIALRESLMARPARSASGGAVSDGRDIEGRLAAFQRALPVSASVPQWLGRIRSAALQSGLALRTVDYKLERTADSPILRYRITLPVTGNYSQVRGFIGSVLADVPAASVDDVQLKREGVLQRTLEARIRLTLFIAAE
jgi:Tfp pilus assembly protein PilO